MIESFAEIIVALVSKIKYVKLILNIVVQWNVLNHVSNILRLRDPTENAVILRLNFSRFSIFLGRLYEAFTAGRCPN